MRGVVSIALVVAAGCAGGGSDGAIALVFDPCQTLVVAPAAKATTAELDSVVDALGLWNACAHTALTLEAVDGAPTVPVEFQEAAGAFFGLYDDQRGVVFVNSRIDDDHARTVTVAHELGHAFGLVHVGSDDRRSVMNPGNLTVEPTAADVAALAALWGACSAPPP